MGDRYEIKHLPLNTSIDNHPYWLVNKLKYILDRLNTACIENKPK
ncbi:hypothetical protein [Sebaldella sp. S0638]|nr:hypothetical protein [Sebaldella sp. S0638]